MTSQLTFLRTQLARLRRARAGLRAASAWSSLATSVIVALLTVFALDLIFALAVPQRIAALLLAAAGVAAAYWRYTRPLLIRNESELDMAILVERQQKIDNDLVAALQFEQPEAASWGSWQLTSAVVQHVATASPQMDVFAGLSRQQMTRRMSLLGAVLAIALLIAALWPGHAMVFLNRLFLGSLHYPTRTRIEQVIVDRTTTLLRERSGNQPADCNAAQGRQITFLVECRGQLPTKGSVQLVAAGKSNSATRLDLKPLSLDDRLARLRAAQGKLNEMLARTVTELSPPLRDEVLTLTSFDAPEAGAILAQAKSATDLQAISAALAKAIETWPAERNRTAILTGELGRLNDDVTYRIAAGDAWTEPALVRMIPLPQVELQLTPLPPKYAAGRAEQADQGGRQLAVLEGSSVELKVICTNRKPLALAWLTLSSSRGTERHDLVATGADRTTWSLPPTNSSLRSIRSEVRYELQVSDTDGLSLPTPIGGTIRIRPDQLPVGVAELVHKVVLPTAQPVVSYRVSDDFGVSRLALVVDVERGAKKSAAPANGEAQPADDGQIAPAARVPAESHRYEILAAKEPLTPDRLPLVGSYSLSLSPLNLAKGDRLKLTLEVTDYRGENESGQPQGAAQLCDAMVLEVSDESGVLAAISQPDQRSAEQLSEIIKRQLGIGEEP
jgi:hypothetical protein